MQKLLFISFLTLATGVSLFSQDLPINESINDFSFDLYNNIKKSKNNFIISPISLGIGLSMAYEGSKGNTQKEFEKVLHYSSNKQNSSEIKDLITKVNFCIDSNNCTKMANSIWIQDSFYIHKKYTDILSDSYNSTLYSIDFSNSIVSSQKINNWVSNSTNSLIKNIVPPDLITRYTRLVLANAVYFTGSWLSHFDPKLTKKSNFYNAGIKVSSIDFMYDNEVTYKYYKDKNVETVMIPYKNSKKVLLIILPKKINKLSETESKLNAGYIKSILEKSKPKLMNLSVPKIKIENTFHLKENLKNIGLIDAFKDHADFSTITPTGIKISEVVHKTFFEIDEYKTVASASTIVIMDLVSAISWKKPKPIIFNADHPFVFMIIDIELQSIIFIGRYIEGS